MIKWTTPTLKCNIPSGLEFDYIILTLQYENINLEKTINVEEVVDNTFSVYFTQEETTIFPLNKDIECQLNIMYGNTRKATNITKLRITKNLHDEVIDNG